MQTWRDETSTEPDKLAEPTNRVGLLQTPPQLLVEQEAAEFSCAGALKELHKGFFGSHPASQKQGLLLCPETTSQVVISSNLSDGPRGEGVIFAGTKALMT